MKTNFKTKLIKAIAKTEEFFKDEKHQKIVIGVGTFALSLGVSIGVSQLVKPIFLAAVSTNNNPIKRVASKLSLHLVKGIATTMITETLVDFVIGKFKSSVDEAKQSIQDEMDRRAKAEYEAQAAAEKKTRTKHQRPHKTNTQQSADEFVAAFKEFDNAVNGTGEKAAPAKGKSSGGGVFDEFRKQKETNGVNR